MQRIAFIYGTWETLWPGIGRALLDRKGVVEEVVERGEAVIRQRLGLSLRAALANDEPFPEALLTPIGTVTQIALSAEWQDRGLEPSALICRCLGEFAAAHTSGAISFEDALEMPCRIAAQTDSGRARGKLIVVRTSCEVAVALSAECPVRYEVVAESDAHNVVVGCALDDVAAVQAFFASRTMGSWTTPSIIAFHTWLIEEIGDDLSRALSQPARPACLPIYSATARGLLPPVEDWGAHFWQVLRSSLSIRAAIGAALDDGITHFVEVGGQPSLRDLVEAEAASRGLDLSTYATMERNRPMRPTMDATLAALGATPVSA